MCDITIRAIEDQNVNLVVWTLNPVLILLECHWSNCLQQYQATNPMGRGSCLEIHTDIQGMSTAWTHWNAKLWCFVCVCVFTRYIYRDTHIYMYIYVHVYMTSLVTQTVKLLPTIQETQVWSLGWEDSPEKEMVSHSSTLAWKIWWTEERGSLQSMGSQRVGHDWATSFSFYFIHIYS